MEILRKVMPLGRKPVMQLKDLRTCTGKWSFCSCPKRQRWLSLLHPTVLITIVVVFITISAVLFGWSLQPSDSQTTPTTLQPPASSSGCNDGQRYGLISQCFLKFLAGWCTLLPILQQSLGPGQRSLKLDVNYIVFYFCVCVSMSTAIIAPAVCHFTTHHGVRFSDIFNYISTVFSIITIAQLAAKVMELQ